MTTKTAHAWMPLGMPSVFAVLTCATALAQQPVRPLPKMGGCPLGYYASGSTCVPSASDNTRGAMEKTGSNCRLGWFSSGSFCLKSR